MITKFAPKREVETKNGKKYVKRAKVQRLITPDRLRRKRVLKKFHLERRQKAEVDKKAYQELVKKLSLKDSILCHGQVNDIREEYLNCSVFVLSSRFEGFGLVLAEAMSVGLASVSFTCPCGPRDIIHDGEDGILCKNGDVKSLAAGICRLIEDEPLRKEMGRKAAQSIQRFTIDRIMQQWDLLFREIVRKNRADNT